MKTRLGLSAAVLGAMLAVAACGGGDSGDAASTTINVTLTEWAVSPSASSASAGRILFAARNEGRIPHELIVLRTDRDPAQLPVTNGLVDEDTAGTVIGEIEDDELPAGGSDSLTVTLGAGKYVLFCNISGHYQQGMYAPLEVR
jgi:uncharacterized cupredoxin-like copper-binding protein